jgi:type I restriction enzyme R subunit
MIVAMSRRIAVDLYKEIIALRPQWHDDDLNKGTIKVVMTAAVLMALKCRSIIRQREKEKCLPTG